MTEENNDGKRPVRGLIGGAISKVKHQLKAKDAAYPERGKPLDGVMPGKWLEEELFDDTGCLPWNCPVRALGYDGEHYYFVDTVGQVFNTGDSSMGVERLQKLFAGHEAWLDWAFPSYDNKGRVTGWKGEMVRRALYAACKERGPWSSSDMVRGRGAWRDRDGKLILHCGEHLWIDGKLHETGEYGDHLYVRRPKTMLPWDEPVRQDDNPAVEIVKILRTWTMQRGDVDAMLILGGLGVGMLGGALEWRPSMLFVGDAGTGKSELTGKFGLLKAIIGRLMVSTTNATEAGLYQLVGHDSVPIAIDELEGDEDPVHAQKMFKMARDAASGSIRIRGGQNHKGVDFQAQSTFYFSGIIPPPIPAASLTRLAIVQLLPLKTTETRAPTLKSVETVGPRLLRILADKWDQLQFHLDDYANILREHGHDARGQKTFGTFLAVAHTMLGDEGLKELGLPHDDLSKWGEWLAAESVQELEGKAATWERALEAIQTSVIENYSGGARRTVAQEVERLKDSVSPSEVRERLALIDIGLIEDPGNKAPGKQFLLAIPKKSRVLAKALGGTPFSTGVDGNWRFAFNSGDPAVIKQQIDCGGGRMDNRVTVAGRQVRCSFVSLYELTRRQSK